MTTNTGSLPTKREMMPYYLIELHHLGGSATVQDVMEKLGERFELDEEQLQMTTEKNDRQPAFFTRVSFANLELRWAEYIEKGSSKFVWSLSRQGKEIIPDLIEWDRESNNSKLEEFRAEVYRRVGEIRKAKAKVKSKKEKDVIEDEDSIEEEKEVELVEEQLDEICKMDPYAFERLCKKLFQAVKYRRAETTKMSRDGGIDGYGFLTFGLVSFKVVFQAKRYKRGNNIVPDLIWELDNARKANGAEKSVFITTSDFTKAALNTANQLGIECINGERLIELLQEHELGYTKEYKFDSDFFDNI